MPLPLPPLPWALIAAGCFALFAISSSGSTRAPFLLEMARDLGTSLALTANLMSLNAITWGVASLVAGAWSDRIGRRPFLVGGPVVLAVSSAGFALAEGFAGVAFWAAVGGAAAGCATAVVAAEVASRVEDRQRGRALGWTLSGQSLALLVGVPAAALLGAAIGWRGVNLVVGAAAVAATFALLAATRAPAGGRAAAPPAPAPRGSLLSPRVLSLLAMTVADRGCFALAITFFATFLQATYGLPVAGLALPLAVFAIGNIVGTLLGGQLADRLPNRLLTYAAAMAASGVLALPLFLWTPGVGTSVALGFGFILANSVARPCLMAALSAVPDAVRGTVLGLNVTAASIGWLAAAALGGIVIAEWGFAPLTAGVALCGAAFGLRARRMA